MSECGNINPEQVFNIIETRVVNEFGRFTHTRKVSPGQWYQYFKQKIKIPKVQEIKDPLPVVQKIPGWLSQLKVFIIRDVLAKLANKQYLIVNLSLAPVLAIFIAYFVKYYDTVTTDVPHYIFYHNSNVPVYFFMSVVVALFVGLIVSAEEIFRDRKILKRERYLNLSSSSYLVSKVIMLFSLSAIQTIMFMALGNWILEIPLTEMRYWLVLFSCSCFANMLGLNISSAFDSAVTIYILIPVLIIPQLLLSGVVISFDKFNPKVGTPNGIPVLGEMMASRWAFEALMVTQFKDNPFEKQFYRYDQQAANANYKRLYFIPTLESRLATVINNRTRWRDRNEDNPVKKALDLLHTEIGFELQMIGTDRFPELDRLQIGKFDSTVYVKTDKFLKVLKQYYGIKLTKANEKLDSIRARLVKSVGGEEAYNAFRMNYTNDAVSDMVQNNSEVNRILEWRGKLVQKYYPIYFTDHRPANPIDFTSNFYVPTKPMFGVVFDTLYFNIAVIWVFTIILYITLYYQLLQKAISSLELYRKYRKRDRN